MSAVDVAELSYVTAGAKLLDAIGLHVDAGRFVAVVGPNGAGKTTLLRALCGLLPGRRGGEIAIGGHDVAALPRRRRAHLVAFVAADDPSGNDLLVRDVVAQGRYAHRSGFFDTSPAHERSVARALATTGLDAFADRILGTLSSGERRRVWIALGLAQEADVLLLDEPTANLDLRHAQRTLATVRALADAGTTVLAALHDLNEAAQFADEIALVDRGRLVALAPPRDLFTSGHLERCYGVRVEILTAADGTPRIFART